MVTEMYLVLADILSNGGTEAAFIIYLIYQANVSRKENDKFRKVLYELKTAVHDLGMLLKDKRK